MSKRYEHNGNYCPCGKPLVGSQALYCSLSCKGKYSNGYDHTNHYWRSDVPSFMRNKAQRNTPIHEAVPPTIRGNND